MSLILPPDVTEASLERALDDLRAVVGAEHVLTAPDDLREFRDPFWHLAWDDYEAAAVVQPASVEEIQAIVRDRQRAPRPAVDDLAGPQQRLRRLLAARPRAR